MAYSTLLKFRWAKADASARFKGTGGIRDYLVKRWETYAPDETERVLWDIAVFEAFLRPNLATEKEISHQGFPVRVWTEADIPGMQADYWDATQKVVVPETVNEPVKPRVYIDSDTANGIDAPYAIFRALVAPEFNVGGLSSMGWTGKSGFTDGAKQSQQITRKSYPDDTDGWVSTRRDLDRIPKKDPVASPAARIHVKANETPTGPEIQVSCRRIQRGSALVDGPGIKTKWRLVWDTITRWKNFTQRNQLPGRSKAAVCP